MKLICPSETKSIQNSVPRLANLRQASKAKKQQNQLLYPLSPPIPAKLPKKVNETSKYFKKNEKQPQKKSYIQASLSSKQSLQLNSSSNIALDTLKIKESFLHLQNEKID